VDFNYDSKLICAGGRGRSAVAAPGFAHVFTDVTAQSKLPKSVTKARTRAPWAVDIEADGDLDLVLGAKDGVPTVLRNNGDGTFLAIHPFAGVSGIASLPGPISTAMAIPMRPSSITRPLARFHE